MLVLEEQATGVDVIVLLGEALALVVEQAVGILVPSDHFDFDAASATLYQLLCFFLNITIGH